MTRAPGPHTALEFYPWVTVRFRCRRCRRYADARLARLAEKFGATETIGALVERFNATCPHRPRARDGRYIASGEECGGYCPDLGTTPPPDLPPTMRRFVLIAGDKDDMLPAETAPAERRRRVGGEE
ncbi:hypothetical protein ACXIUS_01370 [Bosea thiooxidans]